jgi:hypothetical protein
MIKVSVKGLAKFMTSAPAAQRKMLRGYKFPSDDESRAQITYYREAKERIAAFHAQGHQADWLRDQAAQLGQLGAALGGRSETRLRHNARALRHYAVGFGTVSYRVLDDLRLDLIYHGVRVSVVPDLHVLDRGKEKLLKLDFAASAPDPELVKIISQAMFEAAVGVVPNLSAASIGYVDVPRGKVHRGARAGARRRSDIEAACQAIQAIWPTIK